MKYVIIIGVGDKIDREVTRLLLNKDDIHLTFFLRNGNDIRPAKIRNCLIIEGSVMDYPLLKQAISIQDTVYVNLAGNPDSKTFNIINAMKETGVGRIIFIIPAGIEAVTHMLEYRKITDALEESGLDYTILTPDSFSSAAETDYEITWKGEPWKGKPEKGSVSQKSVAALIAGIIESPKEYVSANPA